MSFSTRELAYLGLVAALTLGVGVVLGTGLTAATGIPMIGGVLNGVVTAAILTAGAKGVPKFGSGTILWLVMSALAVPTLTMGPPGIHKPIIGLVTGLVWDVLLAMTRRKNWSYLVSGAAMMLVVMFGIYAAAVLLGLPGEEKLRSALAFIIPINFALGLLGTWLGLKLFDRTVSKLNFVRVMQAQQTQGRSVGDQGSER